MRIEWKSCFKVGLSAFVLYLCTTYWSSAAGLVAAAVGAAAPLIIGCVIAYLVNILMSFYERHYFPDAKAAGLKKSRRPVCMIGSFLTLAAVIVLLINLVVPELAACVQLLFAKLPGAMRAFAAWLSASNLLPENLADTIASVNWQSKIEQIIGVLTTGVSSVMGTAINAISSVFSGIVTALFSFIFVIYLLAGKEKLANQFDRLMKRYMKAGFYRKTTYVLPVMNDCFHRYIVGQCTEAVILGVLCTIGMLILKLPYATMIGALIAFTALIPVAGGYIGAGIGAFMILTVSPMQAVIFLLYIVVLQQLEGNLIYPRVVGSSMGLPGIWVLAAVTVGGGVMGIAGMLLGVPLAATLYRLLRKMSTDCRGKEWQTGGTDD